MSISLNMKQLWQPQTLAFAVTALMISTAQAGTAEQDEIQQLRAEVQALRALIEQNIPAATSTPVASSVATGSVVMPATSSVTSPILAQAAKSSESPLQLKTANGAEAKLYGFVRGDVAYQIEGGDGIFNRINAVSLEGAKGKNATEDRLDSTATTTRLGVDFSTPIQGQKVGGKVEVDFRGNKESLRVRHAYLTYNNWLMGQTTSSFLATDLQPDMLDFGSPLGVGTVRTPMVRYSDKLAENTQYFVGLEKGRDDNRLPALTAKLKHSFADGQGSTSVRALVQEVRARDVGDDTEFGWGLAAGVSYNVNDQLQVMGDYTHIKGDDKFLLYSNTAYNTNAAKDQVNLNESDALSVGATYKISPKLRSTLGYGLVLADKNSDFADLASEAENETLQQAWLNVMYSPVTPITLGLEYVYGERETFNGQTGKDNRIGAMARYNF